MCAQSSSLNMSENCCQRQNHMQAPSKRNAGDETCGETYNDGTGSRSSDRLATVVCIDHHLFFHRLTRSNFSFLSSGRPCISVDSCPPLANTRGNLPNPYASGAQIIPAKSWAVSEPVICRLRSNVVRTPKIRF